jgi:cyclophilin family peptidyl-prolyl cis-trans isomerase
MAKRKAYHFGHVTQGMNVVNAIAKDDVIKRSLLREALWQKFDAPKVFSDYFLNKVEDAKKTSDRCRK